MPSPSVPDPESRFEPGDGADGSAAASGGGPAGAGTVRHGRPHPVRDEDLSRCRQEIRAMAAMFGLLE